VVVRRCGPQGPRDAERLLAPLRAIAAPLADAWRTPVSEPPHAHADPGPPAVTVRLAVPLAGLSATTIDVLLRCTGRGSGLTAVELRALVGAPPRSPAGAGAVGPVAARFLALGLAPVADPAAPPGIDAALARLRDALAPWRAATG
jgi:hypothetical protein